MFISQTICNHFLHFFVRSLNFYWQSYPLSHDTAKLSIPECVQEFLQRLSAAVCCPLRFKFKCKQLLQCASKQTSKKKPGGRGVLNIHDHVDSSQLLCRSHYCCHNNFRRCSRHRQRHAAVASSSFVAKFKFLRSSYPEGK